MQRDSSKWFPIEDALENLDQWSNTFKKFQQRLEKYFARSEARTAAYNGSIPVFSVCHN
jgi:protein involved in sex pheromone biosynthesis